MKITIEEPKRAPIPIDYCVGHWHRLTLADCIEKIQFELNHLKTTHDAGGPINEVVHDAHVLLKAAARIVIRAHELQARRGQK